MHWLGPTTIKRIGGVLEKQTKIFVAGARGLVGSAILRRLRAEGFSRIYAPTSAELDLSNQPATFNYLKKIRPDYIFCAAALVGGIRANSDFPADFCYKNLVIQNNLIHGAYLAQVRKLLFLGSSCIYPKSSVIPVREESLLTGPLEQTNEAYAIAKIAGVKLCDYYRKQYGCDFISAMPTNTYGPNDNYDLNSAHVVPALIHKMHLAKLKGDDQVLVWGTGNPRRELIYIDDIADACVFLMNHYSQSGPINVGTGEDFSIKQIAEVIRKVVGFNGKLQFDPAQPDGVYQKVMDISRIAEMGWNSKVPLEEGMRRAYAWFVEHYDTLQVHPAFKKKPLLVKSAKWATKIKQYLVDPELANKSLDDPETVLIHRRNIMEKPFLKRVYLAHYADFIKVEKSIEKRPGKSIELGSGGGFLKTLLPSMITSDVHAFAHVDRQEFADHLTFGDEGLRAIYMTGVLHHLGKSREFFKEACRCLRDDGVIVMMEPHMSLFGRFFFKRLHHEANDENALRWEFPQIGPLSAANTALPYIIFDRDKAIFQRDFPDLRVVSRRYHTFLTYALSGGVGYRFSAPGWTYPLVALLEKLLTPFMKTYLGTMQTIILKKVRPSARKDPPPSSSCFSCY